ncbi:MAG TPA: HPF/RaiA family ribosome-associated protein [Hyphomicrobiaceae bacterium]|nr:HPF/RaiA family ribosome-associated protein [Hyphomicrobiaceae bacterium]
MADVNVHFHGIDRSEAVVQKAQGYAEKLTRTFDRITHCRVAIEAPHRHAHKARVYLVRIDVGLPGRSPVIISSDSDYNPAHEDVLIALKDAFEAARRQVAAVADQMRSPAKRERGRRRPAPERDLA